MSDPLFEGGVRPSRPILQVRHEGIVPRLRLHHVIYALCAVLVLATALVVLAELAFGWFGDPRAPIVEPTIHEDPETMNLCRAYLEWQVRFGDLDLKDLKTFCPT